MTFLLMTIFAVIIAVADQITKAITVANIPLGGHADFIPGFLSFTYVRNTGAAFSSFQGARWLFILIFLLLTFFVIYDYFAKLMDFTPFERWCIAAVYGGGLGNIIDRVRLGYVVDMIQTDFMSFPVFNLADCFITCGCIVLMLHLAICNRSFWKDGKK